MRLSILHALLCLPTACILPDSDDEDGSGSTSAASETGDTTVDGSTTDTPATTSSSTSAGPSTTEPGDSSGSGDSTDTGEGLGPCVDGVNFEGNPFYTGDFENPMPEGQPVLSDPPLPSYYLAAIDGGLAVETQLEVWVIDDASDTMRRIAGESSQDNEFVPAEACDDLRPLFLQGMATRPDGSIVIADNRGNAVIQLDDPLGDCSSHVIAGNAQQLFDYEIDEGAAFPGDVDGPGATAQFFGVSTPLAVGEDIYVFDLGNYKIKRIAGDADRTVSTLYDYSSEPDAGMKAMTAIDGTLYVTGIEVSDDFVWAIDLATGEREVLHHGRGLFDEVGDSTVANMYALENDGVDLLVASAYGYLFRLSTDGDPLGVIAGYGTLTYYPTDLDVTQPIPVEELPIRSNNTVTASLVRNGSNLYFTGNGGGVGHHIWEIRCE
jgi:hypothetical protein